MKSSIKWIIFVGLLATLFVIAACAPKDGGEEGAIAGQAQYSGQQGYGGGMGSSGCNSVSGGNIVCGYSSDGTSVTVSPVTPSKCTSIGGTIDAATSVCTLSRTACDANGKLIDNTCNSMTRKMFKRSYTTYTFNSCKRSCSTGSCVKGVCTDLPQENNFEDVSGEGEFTVETGSPDTLPPEVGGAVDIQSDNVVVVTDADTDMPVVILEKTAGVDLSGVSGQTQLGPLGSRVVVQNVPANVQHHIVIQNTKNAGAFACPTAQSFADLDADCEGRLTATHEECELGAGFCHAVGKMYIVTVTGSGAGENEGDGGTAGLVETSLCQTGLTAELCDGCDNTGDGQVDEGCTEICDATDNNNDGKIDEGCDDDNDGYCEDGLERKQGYYNCPTGWATDPNNQCCPGDTTARDCDDTNALINKGHSEVCNNGLDDDCNGQIDEIACPATNSSN